MLTILAVGNERNVTSVGMSHTIHLCTIMTSTAHPNVLSSQSEQFSSPYVSVSGNESELPAKYEYRVQSSRFCEDDDHYDEKEIDTLVLMSMLLRSARYLPQTSFQIQRLVSQSMTSSSQTFLDHSYPPLDF
jgi:hypothetical protein